MRAEREYLCTSVFPELERRLRERHHHLEPIDLRSGTETGAADDEQSKELLALGVCLAEIDRARPLQIVLIGDRYGWVPPEDRATAAVAEAGFQTDVAGKSVVALEIEFGLRGGPDCQQQCFFYFREPLDYDRMTPDVAADYSGDPNADKLAELKQRIEREMPDRVRHYRAEWDDQNNTVAGLDDWGRMVVDDLWQALDDETRDYVDVPPPACQEEQDWLLDRFVEARQRGFVGRAKLTEQLFQFARSPAGQGDTWGTCVTGMPGSGKSALFAHLHRALEQEDVILLAHSAGISVPSIRVDSMLRAWTLKLARARQDDAPIDDTSTSRAVQGTFVGLLWRAAEERRVVLLVDGLDQLEPTPRAQRLAWLPEPWPENARLIVTTAPGTASAALERRAGVELVPLAPLGADEARQIAEAIFSRYGRQVRDEVLDALLSKRLPGGLPSAGLPLWLESAVEELLLLDLDDVAHAGGKSKGVGSLYAGFMPQSGGTGLKTPDPFTFSPTPQERLDQLILDTVQKLPPDVDGLYGWLLDRNQKRLGTGWVCGFANLIAASRAGLRESDIAVLLPKVARLFEPTAPRRPWNALEFALLRRAFRAHLSQRGADGGWDFRHSQIREAIRRRYLRDPQLVHRLQTSIAYHLKSLPTSDPLRRTELMVHLIASEDRLRAAHYYSGELAEEELSGATRALVDYILAGSNQTPNEGLGWTASLLIEPKLKKSQVGALCRRYNFELLDALENNAPVDARRRLADATRQAAEELLEQEPDDPQWQQDSVTSYQRLARFHEEAGNQTEAETWWRRCHQTLSAMRHAQVDMDPPLVELLHDLDARF